MSKDTSIGNRQSAIEWKRRNFATKVFLTQIFN